MNATPRHFRRVCDCVRYPGFIAASLVLIGLLSVAPASAKPTPVTIPAPGDQVPLQRGEFCDDFTAVVTFTKVNQKIIQDTTVNGVQTQKITGNAQATVARLDEAGNVVKSVEYNISGPGTIVINPDGSFSVDAHGPNLFWTTKANSFPGVPTISYTTGHLTFAVAAPEPPAETGTTTSYTLAGRQTDVCAALA
jgi:hypothetical protein